MIPQLHEIDKKTEPAEKDRDFQTEHNAGVPKRRRTGRKRCDMIEVKNLTKIYKLNKKQMAEQKTKDSIKKAVDNPKRQKGR